MTSKEFLNLKVGDIVKRTCENTVTLHKILEVNNNSLNHITTIIKTNNNNEKYYVGREFWITLESCLKYELYNSKSKKLYKPWG